MHVAIQAATVAVMAPREANMGPVSGTTTANMGEVFRPRHGGPALWPPSFQLESYRYMCKTIKL